MVIVSFLSMHQCVWVSACLSHEKQRRGAGHKSNDTFKEKWTLEDWFESRRYLSNFSQSWVSLPLIICSSFGCIWNNTMKGLLHVFLTKQLSFFFWIDAANLLYKTEVTLVTPLCIASTQKQLKLQQSEDQSSLYLFTLCFLTSRVVAVLLNLSAGAGVWPYVQSLKKVGSGEEDAFTFTLPSLEHWNCFCGPGLTLRPLCNVRMASTF